MEIKNALVLERGVWTPDQIIVKLVKQVRRHDAEEARAIDEDWQKILAKNPQTFNGPTIRLVGRYHFREKLVLEVVSSNYKEGCTIGWLGVAMVPITADGYVVLQGSVPSISTTVGKGMRVPGCTPENAIIVPHLIKEMEEEFGVSVTRKNLTFLGLTEARPPLARLHHGLVCKVRIAQSREELMGCWQKARDRWEGELFFLKLDYKKRKVSFQEVGGFGTINHHSLLMLALVVENELNINNSSLVLWPRLTGAWQKIAAER